MDKNGQNRGGARVRRIDDAAKAAFAEALRRGVRLAEAGREAGFTIEGFYGARAKDAAFAREWVAALEESAARERGEMARGASRRPLHHASHGPPPQAELGEDFAIVPNNRRRAQLRRMRHVKFTDARKDKFLAHFAGTCDARAAADAAGVDHSTVYKHRARDAQFREAWQEALETGYARLEAELVRERIAAQGRIREAIAPEGEAAIEFERGLKLLTRWERRDGRLGPRPQSPGRHKRPSFDEAIEALAKRLRALDIPIQYLPAPQGEASGPPADAD